MSRRVAEAAGREYSVILQLDHGGPWLKDKHVERNYTFEEALSEFLKSLGGFLRAGFRLIHLDATVDLESPGMSAEPGKAAARTAELLAYAEDLAAQLGVRGIYYEIGSDRWGYKPPEIYDYFLSSFTREARARGLDLSSVIFSVAHVGTEVKPGNRVEVSTLRSFASLANTYGFKLKVHSGDYLENPEALLEAGVGGVNIGPMFAHVMYSSLLSTVVKRMNAEEATRYVELLNRLIASADKLSKYVGKGAVEEYKLGLASRYVWSRPEMQNIVEKISLALQLDINNLLVEKLKMIMNIYIERFNLCGLAAKRD